LLLHNLPDAWLEIAKTLDCSAVVCQYALWAPGMVAAVHAAGMRCLSYTVNDEWATQHLMALGTDGIITDRVDAFSPAT
jgi:glycerophosphoryl diester phosphodiesterase